MKQIVFATLAAVALATAAAPAAAKDAVVFVTTAAIKDKPGAVALDPTKGYVMMRSDMAVPLYLMKIPTAADDAAYAGLRAAALAKAHSKWANKKKEYDHNVKMGNPVDPLPLEPTDENFVFTPFGMLAGVSIGPLNRFAKGDGGPSTYLQELTPGEYRIYGPLSVVPGAGATGICFCMGSVAFTVGAGEVADMGLIAAKANAPGKRPAGDSSAPLLQDGQFIVPTPSDMAVDPRLAGVRIVPVRYRPIGKLPNYFGMTVARIPEMPGVFRYDRDRIVDLTSGN